MSKAMHSLLADFEILMSDFETVMDTLAPEPAALLAISCGAPIAIAYAAWRPHRFSTLAIVNGFGRAYFSAPTTPPVRAPAGSRLGSDSAAARWATAQRMSSASCWAFLP